MLVRTKEQLLKLKVSELKAIAKDHNLKGFSTLKKADLISFIDNNISTFGQPITYVYNDNLNMFSIVSLDYLNLSIKEMVSILKEHAHGKMFSNQVMNEKELKACYRAGFRVRGHETLKETEVLEMYKNNCNSIHMVANTTQYNIIEQEVVEVAEEVATTETNNNDTTSIGTDIVIEWEDGRQQQIELNELNINDNIDTVGFHLLLDESTTAQEITFTVGNKTFTTEEEAEAYCNESDFDPAIMIQNESHINAVNVHHSDLSNKQDINNLYWYEYRLRGFSLGCQPSDFISHNDSIGMHGIVSYNRQLTDMEISDYELIPYNHSEDLQPA